MKKLEYQARRKIASQTLTANQIEAFLISGLPNIRYLTGFTGSNALLLLSVAGDATLLTDPRYTIQARAETDCRVQIVKKGSLVSRACQLFGKHGVKRIAFEKSRMTFAAYSDLRRDAPLAAVVDGVDGLVEKQRMIKSRSEIELIRASVMTNSRAFENGVRRITPSTTESELAAELDFQMRRLGGESAAFETIVAAGVRSALPHARPGRMPLAIEGRTANRLILIDMGTLQSGYTSDMTRVLHIGKPAQQVRKLYNAVLEAQTAALGTVRSGVSAGAVDRSARRVLRRFGLDRLFVHSTGHGLGLEIHEPPRLGRRDPTLLEAGMVITIEPGAYIEDFGGVRIEDTVLVTQTGCEILTPSAKELMVI